MSINNIQIPQLFYLNVIDVINRFETSKVNQSYIYIAILFVTLRVKLACDIYHRKFHYMNITLFVRKVRISQNHHIVHLPMTYTYIFQGNLRQPFNLSATMYIYNSSRIIHILSFIYYICHYWYVYPHKFN